MEDVNKRDNMSSRSTSTVVAPQWESIWDKIEDKEPIARWAYVGRMGNLARFRITKLDTRMFRPEIRSVDDKYSLASGLPDCATWAEAELRLEVTWMHIMKDEARCAEDVVGIVATRSCSL